MRSAGGRCERRSRGVTARGIQCACVFTLGILLLMVGACGSPATSGPSQGSTPDTVPTPTVHTASPVSRATSSSTASGASTQVSPAPTPIDGHISAAFVQVAAALFPVPVYAPTSLPADASLAECWRPVIGVEDPEVDVASSGTEKPQPNPRLNGGGGEPQAEMLVDLPAGGLMFLENFRGDLGDISGETVGTVAGNTATLYDLGQGVLVQWSDGGRWYAVYGWGEGTKVTVPVALSMCVLHP